MASTANLPDLYPMLSHKFFTATLLLLFVYLLPGCSGYDKKMMSVYNNYPFDTAVIHQLPLYDSLATAIGQKLPVLLQQIDTGESYRAFRYRPASYEQGVFNQLPKEAGSTIGHWFTALGKNIVAFDFFKDSTIMISIRRLNSDTTTLGIEENLSFYPAGKTMRPREFPIKDTVLNARWQYWIRFIKPGIFEY
jgi:hypothetical protein